MLEIFKDKQTNLEFSLNIQGNSFTPEARLCVTFYDNMFLTFKATVNNSIAEVSIPPLKDILVNLPFEVVNLHLEVIADQNYFIPWKGQATISNSISVGVTDVQFENIESKKDIKIESMLIPKKKDSIKFI